MLPILFSDDVAAIWTEERRKTEGKDAAAIKPDRVHDFFRWSKPTPEGKQTKNRYADNPMPYPRFWRSNKPAWAGDQEEDLRKWWHDRLSDHPVDERRVAARAQDWAADVQGLIR